MDIPVAHPAVGRSMRGLADLAQPLPAGDRRTRRSCSTGRDESCRLARTPDRIPGFFPQQSVRLRAGAHHAATGRSNQKVLPLFGLLSTPTRPP